MNSPRHSLFRKTAVGLVIFFFIFQLFNPVFLFKHEAVAYADTETGEVSGTVSDVTTNVKDTTADTTKEVKETVLDRLKKGLMLSATIVLRNALVYLSQKLAEQTVNWMATGEWGQGAMFYEQAWGKFKDDIMNATVGTFLDNLRSEVWAETGFDICDPNPNVKISIMIGLELPNLEDPGMIIQPVDCTLSKFIDNWESFGDGVYDKYKAFEKDPGAMSLAYLQESASIAFDVKYAELGTFLKVDDDLKQKQAAETKAQEDQRTEGQGQKPKTSMAGITIQTPAFAGKARTEKEIVDAKDMQKSEADSSKEVLTEIPESMVAAFLNSFVSKAFSELILKKLFEKGVTSNPAAYQPKQYVFENKALIQKEVAQAIQVQKTSFSSSSKSVDLLTQFTSCPQDRQIFNCVADGDFAQAVRSAEQDKPISLKDAMESGKVNGNLPLIPATDGRDKTSNCFEQGWCYSNLMKLRKARIIPIGWEIAASKIEEGETVTLKYAMDNFNVTGNEFFHLVDPEWILRAPQSRCEAEVSGPVLIGAGSDKRAPVCADLKSCLRQDETGKCLAWGYCAAEENLFRFGGSTCPGQYDSCRLMTKADGGEEASLLLNTVDKTGCDPNSAGCKQYSVKMAKGADQVWSWNFAVPATDSLFLNKKIKDFECQPGDEGCTRFVRTGVGLGTSLLGNGGFEVFTGDITSAQDNNNEITGWINTASPATPVTTAQKKLELSTDVFGGLAALSLNGTANEAAYYTGLSVVPKSYTRYYAISAKAKKKDTAANITLTLMDDDSTWGQSMDITSFITGKKDLSAAGVGSWETVYQIVQLQPSNSNAGEPAEGQVKIKIASNGGEVVVDNVVFEEIDSPSAASMHEYSEYGTKNALYLKKAPEYFSCYNIKSVLSSADYGRPLIDYDINKTDDAAATDKVKGCAGFAKLCSADEVGCEAYKVTDGTSTMNGITSFADYCPQECNGYSTFKEDTSFLDKGFFPVYFIPKTAKQCTAAAVGCEEFTSMEDLALGKEAKTYFSEVRLCAPLPEKVSQCKNFYTWEAKESSGYQLQAYYLLDDDADGIPDTSDAPDNLVCNKEIFEAQINPNCRAFYNDGGSVYYREYSKTITCSADCHPYRRTLKYVPYDENGDGTIDSPKVRCINKKGTWKESTAGDVTNGECIFMTIPGESKVCSAEVAGCKAYKGNQAGDEEILLNVQFTTGDLAKFDTTQNIDAYLVTLPVGQVAQMKQLVLKSSEIALGEGEYLLSFWAKTKDTSAPLEASVDINVTTNKVSAAIPNNDLGAWRLYSYNFSISQAEAFQSVMIKLKSAQPTYIDNLQVKLVSDVQYVIKDSWKTPDSCNATLFDEKLDQAQVGCKEYNDRAGNTHYLKSFSGLCSANKVGCEALIDTKNSLSAFNKDSWETVPDEVVCSMIPSGFNSGIYTGVKKITGTDNAKQCEFEYIDATGNSHFEPTPMYSACAANQFNDGQEYLWDDVNFVCKVKTSTNVADSMIYLVNEEKMSCKNTEKGCMALGLPTYKVVADPQHPNQQIETIDTWETNFYKIDPDLFGSLNSPLCPTYALSCEEYKDASDASYFFKDPRAKLCEWRKGKISAETYGEAWFIKGVEGDKFCGDSQSYAVEYYKDGVKHLKKSSDAWYAGWAGLCPGEQDLCTAFVDPTDDPAGNGIGRAYYYLNNELIDKTCTSVSRKTGCLMFNDTTNSQLTVNAAQSYLSPTGTQVPGTGTNPSDSNSLIKVVRDRQCGAWYDCKSSHWAWDPNLNKYQQVCDKMGVCTSLTGGSDSPKCASFETSLSTTILPTGATVINNILTDNKNLTANYAARPTGWEFYDYSGYAMPNSAPIHFYDAFDVSAIKDKPDYKLVNYDAYPDTASFGNGKNYCEKDIDCSTFCGVAKTAANFKDSCRCLSGTCVRANPEKAGIFENAQSPACRAYPTEDAPFPAKTIGAQAFSNVNVVTYMTKQMVGTPPSADPLVTADHKLADDMTEAGDYGCYYSKRTYGGGSIIKYYPLQFDSMAEGKTGYCQESPDIECKCDFESNDPTVAVNIKTKTTCSSYSCGADKGKAGICMIKSSNDLLVDKYYGWQGYCLERDKSITINNNPAQNPCLTWYPTDSLAGLQDIKNTYEEAGYNPTAAGAVFTTQAKGRNADFSNLSDADEDKLCPNATYPTAAAKAACLKQYDSSTATPYIKAVGSISDTYDYGNFPQKNWIYSMRTNYEDADSYAEFYADIPTAEIYEDEIIGIVIKCDTNHSWSDWCNEGLGNVDKSWMEATNWYKASQQYVDAYFGDKTHSFNGFFIPYNVTPHYNSDESGPIFDKNIEPQESAGDPRDKTIDWGKNNYVTATGTMDNYKFYKDDGTSAQQPSDIKTGYVGPWTDWSYWQVVWSGSQTNTGNPSVTPPEGQLKGRGNESSEDRRNVNRYFFGGDDVVLPKGDPWNYYDKKENPGVASKNMRWLAPLFLGTGWNTEDKTCKNTLTGQSNITGVCEGTAPVSTGVIPPAFKGADGKWTSIACAQCTKAGVWELDKGAITANLDGKCIGSGNISEQVCANVRCNAKGNGSECPNGLVCGVTNPGDAVGWCQLTPGVNSGKSSADSSGMQYLMGACDVAYGDYDWGNWESYFGLRVMFDKNHRYRGLWISLCDDSGGWGGQGLEVDFVFKDYAQKAVLVNDEDVTGGNKNAAYTNEIYKKAIDTVASSQKVHTTGSGTADYIIPRSYSAPMGSASQSKLDDDLMVISETILGSEKVDALSPGGSPYSDKEVKDHPDFFGGKPWGCENGKTGMCNNKKLVDAISGIKTYFAKIFKGWGWTHPTVTNPTGKYIDNLAQNVPDTDDTDETFTNDLSHGAPIVAAVIPTGKTDQEGNQIYGAIPGKITINGRTEGNLEGFDGALDVSLKFYAWASDNQMPIKELRVNWGNSSTDVDITGKFKNHKPRCQRPWVNPDDPADIIEPLGICTAPGTYGLKLPFDAVGHIYGYACNDNSDCDHLYGNFNVCEGPKEKRFGDTTSADLSASGLGIASACEEAYFNFNSLYECKKADVDGALPVCDSTHKTNCIDTYNGKKVCRFQPKVQVKDNWGWGNTDSTWSTVESKLLVGYGVGAYSSSDGDPDECMDPSMKLYEFFDGYIYVHPGAE